MTEAERILWACLSKKQLNGARFRKQHPIGDYIADFYCHEYRLVVEVDGGVHQQRKEYDANRSHEMSTVGIRVIRFSNEEIIFDLESVLLKLKGELK